MQAVPAEGVTIERVLDSIVAPIRTRASVLLLVLDGLSFAVARPLVTTLNVRAGPSSPTGRTSPPPLRGPPNWCRDFPDQPPLGRLVVNAALERTAFAASTASRSFGGGSRRFSSKGGSCRTGVKRARSDGFSGRGQRVVGIVHNAVDAQLAGSDQIEVLWNTECYAAGTLLRAAREAGRLIILTGDYGHAGCRN